MESNPTSAVLSLFLLLQLGGALALLLGGLYTLYCFNRAASSAERMADAAEAWLALQHYQVAQNTPSQTPEPNNPMPTPLTTQPLTMQPAPAEQAVVIAKPATMPPVPPSVPASASASAAASQTPNL